ncbi:broad-complex core protein isoforms 1/2/3/4/5-like isoform X5 [Penaeus chinensis]|uniref:broad-complex core protein isoforms 1/2/3/4/5-like isoform X5 n=1 Tax=Penaeus chinensis TaxID=139456 RepID=UPI001FB85322|nr:broad-complex core protein isoforms 1/2/3/4/5-like isoform X5 [Penaeus chinensis]
MGADQQFCLRWNNFHTNITSAFESLRDDEDFVDITLACEGRQIKAHKMVLSACSPYFRSLLKGNPCQHPIVFLKDVTFANLTSILDFMYHGEVNVSHNELATFLKTAEALKVRGLAEDEKKRDSENYNESSSPPPPRDPPDPGSPRPEEGSSAPDTQLSDSPPPKRQRRRSGASVHSAEDTNETVLSEARDSSVKNEPQDFNEEEDMLSQSVEHENIKTDVGEDSEERNFGPSESVTISRSQAAMQQLQESFGSFLPGMGQSPGFLPHGATDMPRPPPYPLEGVQGLPPGISALPGPSMSQGAASQDASQGEGEEANVCRFCGKMCSNRYNLKKHERDMHLNRGAKFVCDLCNRQYSSLNSLQVHRSNSHPTGVVRRRSSIGPLHLGLPQQPPPPSLSTSLPTSLPTSLSTSLPTSLPTSQPQPQLSPQHQQQQQLPAQLQAPIPLPHPQQMIKFQPDEYPPPQPMREDMLHQPPPVFEVDADPSDAAAIAALFRKTLRT